MCGGTAVTRISYSTNQFSYDHFVSGLGLNGVRLHMGQDAELVVAMIYNGIVAIDRCPVKQLDIE